MRGDSVWMGFGMLSCRASNSGDCDDIITGARIKITPVERLGLSSYNCVFLCEREIQV